MPETHQPMTYTCPVCHQKAQLGSHFCDTTKVPVAKTEPRVSLGGLPRWLWSVLGALVVAGLLWVWIGRWAVLAAALVLLIMFALERSQPNSPRASRDAYDELVRMCPDVETADRLVLAEQLKSPELGRNEAVRLALRKYQRDLRR